MDKRLYKCLQEVSNNRVSIRGENFMARINDYQIFGSKEIDDYDISIMKNYIIKEKGRVDNEDILYFLLYFKKKSDKLQIKTVL
jgi:hypothetical protein